MKGKTSAMRVDELTKIAVNILVAKEQMTIGQSLTTGEGLWKFIERCAPDVAKEAKRLYDEQQKKGKK